MMNNWMTRQFFRFLLPPLSSVLWAATKVGIANRTNGKLVSAGVKREYLLYVPKSYDPETPTPLVISIHGYSEWPEHQAHNSRWNELAERHGFIVVYPSGTGWPKRWRMSASLGGDNNPEPDVRFIADLIDTIEKSYNIDLRRIYANGLSNGGGMSNVLACLLAERIAAVGMVAGAYLFPMERCEPARAVPAVVFHGTADPVVPFHGGPSRSFNIPFPDVPQWVASLARRNGCDSVPEAIPCGGAVSGVRYSGAAEVVFYTIEGGGHTWPGGNPLPRWLTGKTSQEIDATKVMWEFFREHPFVETTKHVVSTSSQ